MKQFEVEIEGITPLMHHRMRPEQLMGLLLGAKTKKKKEKTEAEELSPRDIAESHAYKTEDGKYYIPTSYIVGAFIQASSEYKKSDSSRKSMKSIAGGIFRPNEEFAVLHDEKGKPIKSFEVDIRKATNHLRGAVAVCRPRFDKWRTKFTVSVDDGILSDKLALEILEDSGRRVGIGSFRVSKGGYHGQFQVIKWEELKS